MHLSGPVVDTTADDIAISLAPDLPEAARAESRVRLGRIRYGIGTTDLLHLLQLQARQLTTRFDLVGVRSDRLINRIALHLAHGGGFDTAATP